MGTSRTSHDTPRYTTGEEVANAVTHGTGAVFSLVALVLLLLRSAGEESLTVFSCTVFGVSMFLLYLASTLYHSIRSPTAKRVFRILDHSAIYLLIAGTYTPFCLVVLPAGKGWVLFGVVWSLAFLGVVFKSMFVDRFGVVSTLIYVGMGWLIVFLFGDLVHALPWSGIALLVSGGLLYSAGAAFLAVKEVPLYHMVFHLFVLGGTVFHFLSVYFYVL